ncbi:transcriptional regulator [Vibrio sp. HA2012]|uniref:HlyU family transcriptional regulator n=1 Tax=Vibrio sp. HA2012 TaxID=1971595 RepID=UPI000C2C3423|nr:HlyU family transcriptional regulator [Vibrio sp. HA2012]PJC87411.1 transcriptional regulator [Vibrio sp. HA2012]
MGLFSKLFGSVAKEKQVEVEPFEYKSFLIYQEALSEHGQYRIAGRITKEIDGEIKIHRFIRSDLLSSERDANEMMLNKAKMFIDQMGDSIFG